MTSTNEITLELDTLSRRVEAELQNLANGSMANGDNLAASICLTAINHLRRLDSIVTRLPVSADGVPITPGMQLWYRGYNSTLSLTVGHLSHNNVASVGRGMQLPCEVCYSTREAAASARNGQTENTKGD